MNFKSEQKKKKKKKKLGHAGYSPASTKLKLYGLAALL